MIGKLKGQVDSVYNDHLILDVNGVGYLIYCSYKTLSQIEISTFVGLLIETHVREDHINLYGFLKLEEKQSFNILQSVKGVGTRMALAILSHLTTDEIQIALNKEDKNVFHNISGVGKKLAERLITELKDKTFSAHALSSSGVMGTGTAIDNQLTEDAISALINLGVNRSEAAAKIKNILTNTPAISINELIRLALKN